MEEETEEVICSNCSYAVMVNGVKIMDYWKNETGEVLCEVCFDKIVRKKGKSK